MLAIATAGYGEEQKTRNSSVKPSKAPQNVASPCAIHVFATNVNRYASSAAPAIQGSLTLTSRDEMTTAGLPCELGRKRNFVFIECRKVEYLKFDKWDQLLDDRRLIGYIFVRLPARVLATRHNGVRRYLLAQKVFESLQREDISSGSF
jgi:hypothetical protein